MSNYCTLLSRPCLLLMKDGWLSVQTTTKEFFWLIWDCIICDWLQSWAPLTYLYRVFSITNSLLVKHSQASYRSACVIDWNKQLLLAKSISKTALILVLSFHLCTRIWAPTMTGEIQQAIFYLPIRLKGRPVICWVHWGRRTKISALLCRH